MLRRGLKLRNSLTLLQSISIAILSHVWCVQAYPPPCLSNGRLINEIFMYGYQVSRRLCAAHDKLPASHEITMPRRAVSPALSEQGFDISGLLGDVGDSLSNLGGNANVDAKGGKPHFEAVAGGVFDQDSDADGNDDEAYIAAHQRGLNRKAPGLKGPAGKKGRGFQSMGLNAHLLKAITKKGFSVPTPIQRKTIPLLLENQDVVGMARTGSGKTAAFVIPMIEKLKTHSVKVGMRGLVLSPSRELALQTLKAVKELGRGTELRTILLVGGDSLEEQFSQMTSNPDIVIATPGRFLHLLVEMSLDLSSVRYVVFDEADRLFEMGFATQLHEILYALPTSRQTLLFSATLPKSLVEFAKAGLREPHLVRLDAESKMSPDLECAFLSLKGAEKEGALLHLLNDVIQMPTGEAAATRKSQNGDSQNPKKRKRQSAPSATELPTVYSTIIFAATKHHVEYLSNLLKLAGFPVSYVYGSLDQTARKAQVEDFRSGITTILVVTDVAARGIDIPLLANVINYDFPSQPKVFVHRVGRTARAGKKGWSYNFIKDADLPYLLDLQLFLGKKLVFGRNSGQPAHFVEDMVLGGMPTDRLEKSCEWVTKILDEDADLEALRSVAVKGEKLYTKSRNSASSESAKRAKTLAFNQALQEPHLIYKDDYSAIKSERDEMLAKISGFRPTETVFEVGKHGNANAAAETIKKLRVQRQNKIQKAADAASILEDEAADAHEDEDIGRTVSDGVADDNDSLSEASMGDDAMDLVSEDELEVTFPGTKAASGDGGKEAFQESEFFMSYQPKNVNLAEDRGYGVHSGSYNKGSSFVDAARGATMDLGNDESKAFKEASRPNQMRWDKRHKKYVATVNDQDGSKGAKMITGESGQKIAASFKSGRFDAWRRTNKLDRLPKVGEAESARASGRPGGGGRNYKHNADRAPKQPDKYRDDFYKKKKKLDEAKAQNVGRFATNVKAKSELKGVDDVRRDRKLKQRRMEKNARPARKRKV